MSGLGCGVRQGIPRLSPYTLLFGFCRHTHLEWHFDINGLCGVSMHSFNRFSCHVVWAVGGQLQVWFQRVQCGFFPRNSDLRSFIPKASGLVRRALFLWVMAIVSFFTKFDPRSLIFGFFAFIFSPSEVSICPKVIVQWWSAVPPFFYQGFHQVSSSEWFSFRSMFQPRMLVVETDWAKVGQFCKHLGVLETKFDVEEVYTNDLVPMMGKPSVQSVVPGGIFGKKDKRSARHTNDEFFINVNCSFVQVQSPALFNGFLAHLSNNF